MSEFLSKNNKIPSGSNVYKTSWLNTEKPDYFIVHPDGGQEYRDEMPFTESVEDAKRRMDDLN